MSTRGERGVFWTEDGAEWMGKMPAEERFLYLQKREIFWEIKPGSIIRKFGVREKIIDVKMEEKGYNREDIT